MLRPDLELERQRIEFLTLNRWPDRMGGDGIGRFCVRGCLCVCDWGIYKGFFGDFFLGWPSKKHTNGDGLVICFFVMFFWWFLFGTATSRVQTNKKSKLERDFTKLYIIPSMGRTVYLPTGFQKKINHSWIGKYTGLVPWMVWDR